MKKKKKVKNVKNFEKITPSPCLEQLLGSSQGLFLFTGSTRPRRGCVAFNLQRNM